jgi:hypothetical protein
MSYFNLVRGTRTMALANPAILTGILMVRSLYALCTLSLRSHYALSSQQFFAEKITYN